MRNFQLVTFTTIDIYDDSKSRYIHLSEEESIVPIKKLLYNVEYTNGVTVEVVEGLMDHWRFGDGSIPLFGVQYTQEQVKLLSKFQSIKIIGDGDKDGWNLNKKLSGELSALSKVKYFNLKPGIDPDKLDPEDIKYIKNSQW